MHGHQVKRAQGVLVMTTPRPGSRWPSRGAPASCGFTLIELLVTLVLAGVLVLLAAPNFITFQRNSELTTTANSFLATLSAARAEAMKRQLRTFVIPADGSSWSSGWVAFVDLNNNVSVATLPSYNADNLSSNSAFIVVSQLKGLPQSVAIDTTSATSFVHSGVRYAMFNGSGFMSLIGGGFPANGGDSLDFTNGSSQTRRVVASVAGRVRVCKPSTSSTLGDPGCSVGTF